MAVLQPIDADKVTAALRRFEGGRAYVHFEMTRGGFIRNLQADIESVALRGEGPYRVALKCRGDGWVIMEGLTHMDLPTGGPLFLGALESESDQRLTQCLQLNVEPFAP